MVRKIIWTSKADRIFKGILEYYIERNGSKTYSLKLNSEINKLTKLLAKHPFLGKKTDIINIWALVHGNYKIIYKIESDCIVILMVWDDRQNPENFIV